VFKTRNLHPDDLDLICSHRHRMFADNGFNEDDLCRMDDSFKAWLAPRLQDGKYFGYMVEDDGVVVAGVGLMLMEFPPHPKHPEDGQRGYILNVFVEPSYRGKGIAVELVKLSEAEFKQRGVTYAVLHASTMGRPIYEKLGWSASSEMAKFM